MQNLKKEYQRHQNKINNAQGHFFEGYIRTACMVYRDKGIAEIEKTPEPFRVLKKYIDGTFTGRFTSLAQPDFIGTLKGGKSICFEAKYTTTDRIKKRVLTDKQIKSLELHSALGALTGICVGIQDKFFFVPLEVWTNMKSIYSRQYLLAEDIEQYRVKFTGAVMFLDYLHKK